MTITIQLQIFSNEAKATVPFNRAKSCLIPEWISFEQILALTFDNTVSKK